MKLQKKLESALAREFSSIRPDILKAVVWLTFREIKDKSPDEMFEQLFEEDPATVDPEERDEMIYETLLESARETCYNEKELVQLKKIVERIAAKVRAKPKPVSQMGSNLSNPASATKVSAEINRSAFFSRKPHLAVKAEKTLSGGKETPLEKKLRKKTTRAIDADGAKPKNKRRMVAST